MPRSLYEVLYYKGVLKAFGLVEMWIGRFLFFFDKRSERKRYLINI